jgi:hypothetical protein
MPDAIEPPQRLDVQMQQFAGALAFVADGDRLRFEAIQPVQPEPAQGQPHCRARQAQRHSDPRSRLALTSQLFDGGNMLGAKTMRTMMGC